MSLSLAPVVTPSLPISQKATDFPIPPIMKAGTGSPGMNALLAKDLLSSVLPIRAALQVEKILVRRALASWALLSPEHYENRMIFDKLHIKIRPAQDRGYVDHGWLKSDHTFSFADYYDSAHLGLRSLRVINEDRVEPARGFGEHSHRDMEIITIVLKGTLVHKDSMGNASVIKPDEIQRMTAGSGVRHSEFNHSFREFVHFFQIWILPSNKGLKPSYEQKSFFDQEKKNKLRLFASDNGREGSMIIHQDVKLYDCRLENKRKVIYPLQKGRDVWVQVKEGQITINGFSLKEGDGAAIETKNESFLDFEALKDSDFLLFD